MSLRFTEKPLPIPEFEAEVPDRDFEEQRTLEKLDFRLVKTCWWQLEGWSSDGVARRA